MRKNLFTAAAFAAATIGFAAPAQAVELVDNGGFETGTFSSWTVSGNTGFTGVSTTNPHTGNYAAFLGPVGSTGTISQMINTIAGHIYTVSFWLMNSGGTPNSFSATFDGHPAQVTLVDNGAFSYQSYSFLASGSAPSLLSFTFQQDPSFWYLDDISVQGDRGFVPEPATWAMMLLGFGGIGLAMRRRRRPALAQVA